MPPDVRVACAGGLLMLVAGSAAVALAASSGAPVIATEKVGDAATGAPDLTRLSLQRGHDGRLRAGLTFADPLLPKDLRSTSGPPGSVCLRVYAVATPGVLPPDYLVCATSDVKGKAFRGTVLAEQVNALPMKVGSAAISRTNTRNLVMRFSQSAVGRPTSVRFAGEATRAGCIRASCVDTLPDAPKAARLTLRPAEAPPER